MEMKGIEKIVLAIVLVVVALSIFGALVPTAMTAGDSVNDTILAGSATNESHFANTTIGFFNLNALALTEAECTLVRVGNFSKATVIVEPGNYTQNGCWIDVTTADGEVNNTYWNVTYTYVYGTKIPFAALFAGNSIIFIVIAAGLLITIVLSFMRRRK